MLSLGYRLLKPLLFSLDAERAHTTVLGWAGRWPRLVRALHTTGAPPPSAAGELFGLPVPSPVGLAAGLDKDGEALLVWEKLGFGHIEVGTVTPKPQPGNETPRVFRLVDDEALINWMGFPSSGAEKVARRLAAQKDAGMWPNVPVGFNLGKNKDTPAEKAAEDYRTAATELQPLADYFTVNVSSPNTPGLRALQVVSSLEPIIEATQDAAKGIPVALKLSPDLDGDLLAEAVELAVRLELNAIIATNTTVKRPVTASEKYERGGLSGAPLHSISSPVIRDVIRHVDGALEVVGVGGIDTPEKAKRLLDDGCSAVQIYTGLVFKGPGLIQNINAAV